MIDSDRDGRTALCLDDIRGLVDGLWSPVRREIAANTAPRAIYDGTGFAQGRAMPRPAPRVEPATTVTCPVSGRADFSAFVNGRVGGREFGLFFKRAMLVQEFVSTFRSRTIPPQHHAEGVARREASVCATYLDWQQVTSWGSRIRTWLTCGGIARGKWNGGAGVDSVDLELHLARGGRSHPLLNQGLFARSRKAAAKTLEKKSKI